jgi:hypothetical protein
MKRHQEPGVKGFSNAYPEKPCCAPRSDDHKRKECWSVKLLT